MSEQDFVVVGETEYKVVKSGRAQAEQVVRVTKWLAKHGVRAFNAMKADGTVSDLTSKKDNGIEILTKFVEALDADALVDLFYTVTGCTREEAEVYFDISILIDVVMAVYEKQPAVRKLIDRFFSNDNSTPTTAESSTTSEQPTDGQTTS